MQEKSFNEQITQHKNKFMKSEINLADKTKKLDKTIEIIT